MIDFKDMNFDELLFTEEEEKRQQEGWVIDNLDKASYASRKLAYLTKKMNEYKDWAKREKNRIDEVLKTELNRFQNDYDFLTNALAYYHEAEMRAGRTTKTLNLPGGTLRRTKRQPKLQYEEGKENDILQKLINEAPELTRAKYTINDREFRKTVDLAEGGLVVLNGEILEGIMWEEQEDSVSFKPVEEEEQGE